MARKSRKQNVIIGEQAVSGVSVIDGTDKKNGGMEADSTMQGKKCYRTVIYTRISDEDERKIASKSIENQQEMLIEYVNKQEDMQLVDKYMDRAISGTKFDRPDFNRMIADMRQGKFECIVVKDLSRLGRNYLESGEYIEKIFPFFRIRFVAVTDNYDSLHSSVAEDGIIVPLKNMINEAYAKDISKKICTSVEEKQRKGKFVGAIAPYGYKKAESDNSKLVPDPVTAPTIERIFNMTLNGIGRMEIARTLNSEGIPSPMQYRLQTGIEKNSRYKNVYWDSGCVYAILRNPVYMGDMEQRTEVQAFYKGEKPRRTKKDERIYVKDTHQAIVSRDDYEKVQRILDESAKEHTTRLHKYDHIKKKDNIFRGVLYCGDCDNQLSFYRRTMKLKSGYKIYYTYLCANTKNYGEERCCAKNLKMSDLEELVKTILHNHISCFVDNEKLLIELNSGKAAKGKWWEYQQEILDNVHQLELLQGKNIRLYDDYVEDIISEKDYLKLKKKYISEIELLSDKVDKLKSRQKEYEPTYKADKEVSDVFHEYEDFEELTSDMVQAFIKKIIYYGNKRFEIIFNYQNEIDDMIDKIKDREADLHEV